MLQFTLLELRFLVTSFLSLESTFADSNFFTVAISGGSYTGPVGIDRNIKLWLKADAGVSGTAPVSGWTDQSGNDFNVTVPANGPDLLTDQINFNPASRF